MNIRDKLLNSNQFNFEESGYLWHENPVFKLTSFIVKDEEQTNLEEIEVFLGLTREPLIFLNDLKLEESQINPDFLIFASRHTSKTTRPAFLVHTTGNWGNHADFGGDPSDLSQTSALLQKAGFISLIRQEKLGELEKFSEDIEVTHHGPTNLEKPMLFMELGSSQENWNIKEAGEFLATVILQSIFKYIEYNGKKNQEIGVGFGGTHYAPNFSRLIRNKDVAMSFICPKYYIQGLSTEIINKMINNTKENVDYFIIDWKGTNSDDKKHLIPLLEEFSIPIKKTKEF
ncbi:hypothetical protein LCGC14_1011260 [marine sediment metagenome]|uniref:D-tyrosyl-tRNA(Tyr) deacylase n=2 Tax=marine sediment metagenome TaxID=412755 RepID=A0A0F9NLL0_9ZZZZ|nr:MAG: D-tyrosyl-tRNA(Tyr) deacylase [Candidatus Lokiarchaeum sp. GC14_75]